MHRFFLLFVVVGLAAVALTGAAVALAPQVETLVSASQTEPEPITLNPLAERSLMFDRHERLMAVLHAEQNRSPVALADVPEHVIQVILAVEDENFYEHDGVNLRATFRALFANVSSGEVEQGGSTITMQLVKTTLLNPEQDLERKTREAVLARRLEDQMSKDEILERYLNAVYFGRGAYGLQAAAETYFGVGVAELDIPQAALLAALIRSPNTYDPFTAPELALERRNLSIQRLVDVGLLTEQEGDTYSFVALPTEVPRPVAPPVLDYFPEEVKQQLLDDPAFGLGATPEERYNSVFGGGLRIYTTFDPGMQRAALDARREVLPNGDGTFTVHGSIPNDPAGPRDHIGTASIVSVEPGTGAIRAMLGGPGFTNFQYNIATHSPGRQTGSSFKVFVLLTLLENGYVPNDMVDGTSPCRFANPNSDPPVYEAENFAGSAGGGGTITSQTLRSSNCAYVRLGEIVGQERVVEMTQRLGLGGPVEPVLALPLGTEEVTPLDMAASYAAIPNDGIYNEPYYVDRIENRNGTVLYQHEPNGVRAFSVQTARLAAEILEGNVRSGTGGRAAIDGRPTAGKTGTVQNSSDAWFVGFTPQLSTAVWMGVPAGQVPLRNVGGITVTGGSYPARMWGDYVEVALANYESVDFNEPDGTRAGRQLEKPEIEQEIDPELLREFLEFQRENPDE